MNQPSHARIRVFEKTFGDKLAQQFPQDDGQVSAGSSRVAYSLRL